MAKQNLEQKTKHPYVIALPNVKINNVPEYSRIPKTGATLATSEARAVGNHLFRNLQELSARTVMKEIRDELGGYKEYVLEIDSEDLPENQTIEIAYFLSAVYEDKRGREYEREARKLLEKVYKMPTINKTY